MPEILQYAEPKKGELKLPMAAMFFGLLSGPFAVATAIMFSVIFRRSHAEFLIFAFVMGTTLNFAMFVRRRFCDSRLNAIRSNIAIAGPVLWTLGLLLLYAWTG